MSVLTYPLILAALVLAFANGSNDNFKAVATLYGSGAMGYRAALRLATGAQIAGSLASIVIAGTLLKAFSGKGLVPADVVPRFRCCWRLGWACRFPPLTPLSAVSSAPVSPLKETSHGVRSVGASSCPFS